MKLSWLIETDVPVSVNVGELTREIEAFTGRLIRFHSDRAADPKLTVILLGPDQVIVDAEALMRLQAKVTP